MQREGTQKRPPRIRLWKSVGKKRRHSLRSFGDIEAVGNARAMPACRSDGRKNAGRRRRRQRRPLRVQSRRRRRRGCERDGRARSSRKRQGVLWTATATGSGGGDSVRAKMSTPLSLCLRLSRCAAAAWSSAIVALSSLSLASRYLCHRRRPRRPSVCPPPPLLCSCGSPSARPLARPPATVSVPHVSEPLGRPSVRPLVRSFWQWFHRASADLPGCTAPLPAWVLTGEIGHGELPPAPSSSPAWPASSSSRMRSDCGGGSGADRQAEQGAESVDLTSSQSPSTARTVSTEQHLLLCGTVFGRN